MTEHERPRSLPEATPSQPTAEMIAEALDGSWADALDPAFGDGHEITVGPDGVTRLALYPRLDRADPGDEQFAVVRLTALAARMELYRAQVELGNGLVRFSSAGEEGDSAQLLIRSGGGAIFQLSPHHPTSPPESTEKAPDDVPGPEIPDGEETAEIGPLTAPSENLPDPSPTSERQDEGTEQQPRLTILGRVGRAPRFRETRRGTKLASFPVAVPEADGSTTWHRVTAFNARAEQLAELGIDKGDRIEVIGYLHQRERRRRDGTPYTSEELYAAVIKLR